MASKRKGSAPTIAEWIKKNTFLTIVLILLLIFAILSFSIDKLFSTPQVGVQLPKFVDEDSFDNLDEGTNPNAETNFIFFADTQCPFTYQMKDALESVYNHYKNDVNFVYRNFPLENIHPDAVLAGQAVECAADQNLRWEYFFNLLDHPDAQKEQHLIAYAEQLGLNVADFTQCLQSEIKKPILERDLQDGILHRVPGTPTMFVGGRVLEGIHTEAQLSLAITEALK